MVEWIAFGFLLIAGYLDARYQIIPNKLQLIAIPVVYLSIWFFDPGSIKTRAVVALVLTLVFLAATLLGQSGGGDLKMMVWFGAGFGLLSISILILSIIIMTLFLISKRLLNWTNETSSKSLPLAPFLVAGFVVRAAIEKGLTLL